MAGYRTFLFPSASIDVDRIVLDTRESHHLIRVLRACEGHSVTALDGQGGVFTGSIVDANAKAVMMTVQSKEQIQAPETEVVLLQAIPKGKAMDLILRMATEIGATAILPIFTEHGEVRMSADRLQTKVEKWKITLVEACKQCGVPWLPKLHFPVSLSDWLMKSQMLDGTMRIVASLETGSIPLSQALSIGKDVSQVTVAVGPEGDFSTGEYGALREAAFQSVRLGRNVLRAETAAAYILSNVDQQLNHGQLRVSSRV